MSKITLATIKVFIKKNENNLYLNTKTDFDGMSDGLISKNEGFKKALKNTHGHIENTLGYEGFWFVRQSRDYFLEYEDEEYKGYEISNCCGRFIIAIKKIKE